MIDLHCHILPGVDDGPVELAEAVAMCRQAAATGCSVLVATPHQHHPSLWNCDRRRLEALLTKVRRGVGDRLRLYLGAEIRLDRGFLDSLDRLTESGMLSLADSAYLLLEFDRRALSFDPVAAIHAIRTAGWRPVVAHPEFIPGLGEDLELAMRLIEAGALLQITAMSLTGDFGQATCACVEALLDRGLVHFVASDAHDSDWRPPGLRRAQEVLARRWGDDMSRRLTIDNPLAVIENRPIEAPSATVLPRSRR